MREQAGLTVQGLSDLYAVSRKNGTEISFCELAVKLAALADAEIERLRAQLATQQSAEPAAVILYGHCDYHLIGDEKPTQTVSVLSGPMAAGTKLYTHAQPAAAIDEPALLAEFDGWWSREGEFLRAGGGDYEKTFAWHAYREARAKLNAQPLEAQPSLWRFRFNNRQIHTEIRPDRAAEIISHLEPDESFEVFYRRAQPAPAVPEISALMRECAKLMPELTAANLTIANAIAAFGDSYDVDKTLGDNVMALREKSAPTGEG